MPKLRIVSPTVMIIPEDSPVLRKYLSYRDRSVEFQISKLKRQAAFSDWAASRMETLKKEVVREAFWFDEDGQMCTHPGLAKDLQGIFHWEIENLIEYPKPILMPWA